MSCEPTCACGHTAIDHHASLNAKTCKKCSRIKWHSSKTHKECTHEDMDTGAHPYCLLCGKEGTAI